LGFDKKTVGEADLMSEYCLVKLNPELKNGLYFAFFTEDS